MLKVWDWIKRYWKWIIFPVGLIGLLSTALVGAASRRRISTVPPPDFSQSAEEAMEAIRQANIQRDIKLTELQIKHRNRIMKMSEDQRKELDELRGKPIEEVVKWFDRF